MWLQLTQSAILFTILHTLVWFSTNLQFVKGVGTSKSIFIAILLSIPITICAFFATRIAYSALSDSLWSVRFIGFGISYLVFPILTWVVLGESMLTLKTLSCIFLSIVIVCIQVFL